MAELGWQYIKVVFFWPFFVVVAAKLLSWELHEAVLHMYDYMVYMVHKTRCPALYVANFTQ